MAEQHAAVELAEALDRCSDCQSTALLVAAEVEALRREQASSEEVMLELKAKEEAAMIVELAAVRRVHEGMTSAVPGEAQNAALRKAEAARAMAAAKAREEDILRIYEEATMRAGREQARLMAAEQQVAEAESWLGQARAELSSLEKCLERQRSVEGESWCEMEGLKLQDWEGYSQASQQRLASEEMRNAKEAAMHAVAASHKKRITVCQQHIRDREATLPALEAAQDDSKALMTIDEQKVVAKEQEEKEAIAELREQLRQEREEAERVEAEKEAAMLAAEHKRREEKATVQAQLHNPFQITSFVHSRAAPPPRVRSKHALPCALSNTQKPLMKALPKPSSFVTTTKNEAPPRRRRRASLGDKVSVPPPVSISTQTEFEWVDETPELIQWHLDGWTVGAEEEHDEEGEWHEAADVVFVDESTSQQASMPEASPLVVGEDPPPCVGHDSC